MGAKNLTEILSITQPESLYADAYRKVRTNLCMRQIDSEIRLINVVSATAGEAKTTTACNLAAVYAQLGKKVLLVDLDLRLPSIHKKLGIKNTVGITDALSKQKALNEVLFRYRETFDVLLSGTKTPFSSEFIQSNSLKVFLLSLKQRYDIIIVDCPPVNAVSDGLITSTYCDGTVFCVASGQDERADLEKAKESLESVGAKVLGVVMTRMPKTDKYSKYGYERR